MYLVIFVILVILLLVCNQKTIENFTSEKCDINEQRFKLIEEKIALQKKVQPVVVNNNLCEESNKTPNKPIIIKEESKDNSNREIEEMIRKQQNENDKKLSEINKKLKDLNEKEEKQTDSKDLSELYSFIGRIKDNIELPNNLVNNIIVGLAVIFGLLLMYFLIITLLNMSRRKKEEVKMISLSFEDAAKQVKEQALRKKYGLSDKNLFI